MCKIFSFETSRGVYSYIGGDSEEDARSNFPSIKNAPCVGEVMADEFFITTTTSPTVLYKREARSIRAQRSSCAEAPAYQNVTLRVPGRR